MRTEIEEAVRKLMPEFLGVFLAVLLMGIVLVTGKVLVDGIPLTFSDMVQFLTLLVISAALFVAIWVQRRKEKFDRSLVYLENGIDLVEKAKRVLIRDDGSVSNHRVDWVTAARLISRSQLIVGQIDLDPHKRIFESTHDYFRHDLGETLRKDKGFQNPAFFLGTEDTEKSLGEAACDPDEPSDTRKWIPREIVSTIIRFIQYPSGFDDPLSKSMPLNRDEIEKLWLDEYQAVMTYLQFRDRFYKVGGKVNGRTRNGGIERDLKPNQIDSELKGIHGMFSE